MENVTINQSVFQNLLENIPGMLYRCRFEPSWPILYVSKGSFDLTGYYPEELIQGKVDFASLIYPADRDWVWEHFTAQLSKKENCNCEYRMVSREGKAKWVREIASGVFDESGALLYIEGYIIDISEKKEHHKIISTLESQVTIINTNERRLRALLDAIPDSLLRITAEGNCFEYSSDESGNGKTVEKEIALSSIFPENISNQFISNVRKAIRTAQRLSFEYEIEDDGHVRYFEARMVKSGDNEVVSIIRDVSETIRSKQEIDRTARFYQEIINNSNSEIAVFDKDQRYRYVSKTGINDENVRNWIIGKNDFEYCKERGRPLDMAERRAKMFELVKKLKRTTDWIEKVEDQQGQFRYFVRNLSPFTFENEEFFLGHSTEITALKVVQNELQRREQLFSCSQEIAKIGYWVSYKSGESFEWSESLCKILEIDQHQLSPSLSNYLLFVHPDDRKNVSEYFNVVLNGSNPASLEYRVVTSSGHVKYVKERSQPDEGQIIGADCVYGVIQDITDFHLSKAALEKRENHFRAIAESSPGLIIEADRDLAIRYINTLQSRRLDDVIGKSVLSFTHPDYRELFREKLEACFATGEVQHLQIIGEGISSEWYEVTIGPVKDNSNNVETLVLLSQNITNNKKNEKERERLIQEINHRYNELMQFNYIVSHNLRAPVANILGMSYLLNIGLPEEETKEMLAGLVNSAESIDALIKDLNNILAARSPLNEKKEKFYLKDVIQSILHDLESQLQTSYAVIDIQSSEASEVTSIRSYIQSVLHHLISNSIKYKHPERQPEIKISSYVDKEHIEIEITDNGIGIDLNLYKDQVFGLYKRFTNTVAGKGLGLHMVKAQIESLGGSIEIDSNLGVGTTFRIRLAQG